MAEFTLNIKGFDELLEDLYQMNDDADKIIPKALELGVKPITKEMRERVPKDQEVLLRAIAEGEVKTEGSLSEINTGVDYTKNPEAFYAHMVEFGTVNTQAQPFEWQAYENNKKLAIRIIRKTIRDNI